MQQNLLIPRNAGDEMMHEMAGLAPGPSPHEQAPKANAKAPRSAPVLERHEIVFTELAQTIHVETHVRHEDQHRQYRELETEGAVDQVTIAAIVQGTDAGREYPTRRIRQGEVREKIRKIQIGGE